MDRDDADSRALAASEAAARCLRREVAGAGAWPPPGAGDAATRDDAAPKQMDDLV